MPKPVKRTKRRKAPLAECPDVPASEATVEVDPPAPEPTEELAAPPPAEPVLRPFGTADDEEDDEHETTVSDAWRVLGFVAGAGLFSLALVGIGVWYGRQSQAQTSSVPPQLPGTPQLGGLQAQLAAYRGLPQGATPASPQGGGQTFGSVRVSASPTQLVEAGRGRRHVRVSTDQAIYVRNGPGVGTQSGMLIEPGVVADLGIFEADEQLWAVRAGSNDAQTSVAVRAA